MTLERLNEWIIYAFTMSFSCSGLFLMWFMNRSQHFQANVYFFGFWCGVAVTTGMGYLVLRRLLKGPA